MCLSVSHWLALQGFRKRILGIGFRYWSRSTQMSTKKQKPKPISESTEWCETCDEETRHEVWIELVTESRKRSNAEFSREPYRVTRCTRCDDQRSKRMNNA